MQKVSLAAMLFAGMILTSNTGIVAYADELPFGGKTVINETQSVSNPGILIEEVSESVTQETDSNSTEIVSRGLNNYDMSNVTMSYEELLTDRKLTVSDNVQLPSQDYAIMSTEKYDISCPSSIKDVFRDDYSICSNLIKCFDSQAYDYDFVNDVLRIGNDTDLAKSISHVTSSRSTKLFEQNQSTGSGLVSSNVIPFKQHGDCMEIGVVDIQNYINALGGSVDPQYLSMRLFTGTARAGWDLTFDQMQASVSDKLIKELPVGTSYGAIEIPDVDLSKAATSYVYLDDLRRPVGLSGPEMKKALSGVLSKYSDFIVYCERKYNVSAAFINAVAVRESSAGTAGYGRSDSRCNLFSVRLGNGSYKNYRSGGRSVDEAYMNSIEEFCKLISTQYLSPSGAYYGGSATSYGVNKYYAENKGWSTAIEASRKDFYDRLG